MDGDPGAAWAQAGTLVIVFEFAVVNGKITGIELIADPEAIGERDVEFFRG